MKTNQILTLLFCLFIFIGIYSCGKDSDPVTDTYIPDLSAAPGWVNVADANDFVFFFNTPPVGSATGTFSGNRNGTANSGGFTGSFNHSAIELTFNSGVNTGRLFTGTINGSSNPVVISLSSPASGTNAAISVQFKR